MEELNLFINAGTFLILLLTFIIKLIKLNEKK